MIERRRRGMTVIEVVISVLVGLTVMGTAYTFYESSTKLGRKATGISAAAQVAAQFFYMLESDIANLRPQGTPEETFNTEDGDPTLGTAGSTAGTRRLYFTRHRFEKEFRIDFDSWNYTETKKQGVEVTYEAVFNDKTKLFDLNRYVMEFGTGTVIQKTDFVGAWAKDVRFTRVKQEWPKPAVGGAPAEREGGAPFLRVALMLVGEIDPEKVSAANATKPVLLSALYRIRTAGSSGSHDRLDDDE